MCLFQRCKHGWKEERSILNIAQVVKDDHFAQLERIDLLGSIDVILGDGQITWQVGQLSVSMMEALLTRGEAYS